MVGVLLLVNQDRAGAQSQKDCPDTVRICSVLLETNSSYTAANSLIAGGDACNTEISHSGVVTLIAGDQVVFRNGFSALDGSRVSASIAACRVSEVNELSSSNGVRIYPNPLSDLAVIEYPTAIQGDVSIQVYNMLGSKVMDLCKFRSSVGPQHGEVNVQSLAVGCYTFVVEGAGISESHLVWIKR